VQELRPSALRSELAFRALRVSDSSPLADSGSPSKNFFSWQRGDAATWEQRTFESVTKLYAWTQFIADPTAELPTYRKLAQIGSRARKVPATVAKDEALASSFRRKSFVERYRQSHVP
jgi:hypothetical protein